jgi:hypothetical protein
LLLNPSIRLLESILSFCLKNRGALFEAVYEHCAYLVGGCLHSRT